MPRTSDRTLLALSSPCCRICSGRQLSIQRAGGAAGAVRGVLRGVLRGVDLGVERAPAREPSRGVPALLRGTRAGVWEVGLVAPSARGVSEARPSADPPPSRPGRRGSPPWDRDLPLGPVPLPEAGEVLPEGGEGRGDAGGDEEGGSCTGGGDSSGGGEVETTGSADGSQASAYGWLSSEVL